MADLRAPGLVLMGQTNVAAAGTQVILDTAAEIRSVSIKALSDNTDNIFVGGAAVSAANGFILAPGESVSVAINNLANVWIDSAVNGEGVSYIAVA